MTIILSVIVLSIAVALGIVGGRIKRGFHMDGLILLVAASVTLTCCAVSDYGSRMSEWLVKFGSAQDALTVIALFAMPIVLSLFLVAVIVLAKAITAAIIDSGH